MSETLVLRTALGPYDHVRALREGTVGSDRVRLNLVDDEPIIPSFRRMVRELSFDVCEIAIVTLAQSHTYGKPITALPIVLSRRFHHKELVCNRESPLKGPEDLKGKRIGVRAYSQTTGVWVRGILQSEYGVDPTSITWVTEEGSHVEEYSDPPNVERVRPGDTLLDLLASGGIDAAIGLGQAVSKDMRPVIPDPEDAASVWYRKTRIYPANHVLGVKSELLVQYPWLAQELFELFTNAKQHARAAATSATPLTGPMRLVGDDPLPYGMAANRRSIESLLEFTTAQALTPETYRVEDLFAQTC